MPTSTSDLLEGLAVCAAGEGLSVPRITKARLPLHIGQRLAAFVAKGQHGDMAWLAERQTQRASPDALWPEARSALVFAQAYGQGMDAFARLEQSETGVISTYALNRDYHDLFKAKLKRLARWLQQHTSADVKVFVDTAPLMEKPLAAQAGLGWQGKHSNLVSRQRGNWFFIGTILTTADLPPDESEQDHCGSCTACLDICPTQAFVAPYQLDARRCISYLTIEHKGHIDRAFRKPMGNRIYGCDDCLAICPWNKFAVTTDEARLTARPDLIAPQLAMLLQLDDAGFRNLFSGSPVKRTGRDRFVRNCLIAAGNSGLPQLVAPVEALLRDASPLVRAMAVWALQQLLPASDVANLREQHTTFETDADVQREWNHSP
jgi:epoxyqueuosine reductase